MLPRALRDQTVQNTHDSFYSNASIVRRRQKDVSFGPRIIMCMLNAHNMQMKGSSYSELTKSLIYQQNTQIICNFVIKPKNFSLAPLARMYRYLRLFSAMPGAYRLH